MINVLLADKDQDNIRNIRTYISGTFADVAITDVLTDPDRDVMAVLGVKAANLIIADIHFFGQTGYAVMREIHERYPKLRFIVYGYYNDNEHMEQGRDYGVLEYLYRPLRRADLSRVLHSAIAYFERADVKRREETRFEEHYREHIGTYRELFLRDLLNGRIAGDAEIHDSFDYFEMDFDKGFTVFIVRVDDFKRLIMSMGEMEKHILSLKIARVIHDAAPNYRIATAVVDFNAVAAVMGGYEDLDKTIEMCEAIRDEISTKAFARVTIGLGRTYDNSSEICVSYREAESALRYRFHLGENTVIPIHYMEPSNNITYRFPAEKESRLVFTAVIGEYEYCRVLLGEIFDALRASEPLPEKFLPKMVMGVIISINRYVSEKALPLQTDFNSFFPSKDVLRINGIDEAFEYLDNTLRKFCGAILESQKKIDDEIVGKAKNICEERYYESASLPKIALELGATPEYVNRLFMDREKKTLADYITGIRLAEAKRLIRESELNDDMIAVKIGYDEGRQFRSVFRQYEGINVSDYRTQYNALNSRIGRRL